MLCYFHVAGAVDEPDDEGTEVSTIDAARHEAIVYLASMLRDHPEALWSNDELRVEVTDASRLSLFTVTAFATRSPATSGGSAFV